jgi:hypothetical protein
MLAELLVRMSLRGVPDNEADLFSYLFFDASFAQPLIELGRADAEAQADEILDLLSGASDGAPDDLAEETLDRQTIDRRIEGQL